MSDQERKTLRHFYCRDSLWQTFERMSDNLDQGLDDLINEAMTLFARQQGSAQTTPALPQHRAPTPPPPPPAAPARGGPPPPPAARPFAAAAPPPPPGASSYRTTTQRPAVGGAPPPAPLHAPRRT